MKILKISEALFLLLVLMVLLGDEDIYVPLNFLRVKGWEKILESHGFDLIKATYLGINEPVVPEHQILLIADQHNG